MKIMGEMNEMEAKSMKNQWNKKLVLWKDKNLINLLGLSL
jgi:hypothetical protein